MRAVVKSQNIVLYPRFMYFSHKNTYYRSKMKQKKLFYLKLENYSINPFVILRINIFESSISHFYLFFYTWDWMKTKLALTRKSFLNIFVILSDNILITPNIITYN